MGELVSAAPVLVLGNLQLNCFFVPPQLVAELLGSNLKFESAMLPTNKPKGLHLNAEGEPFSQTRGPPVGAVVEAWNLV